jgi:hypothetical protein
MLGTRWLSPVQLNETRLDALMYSKAAPLIATDEAATRRSAS